MAKQVQIKRTREAWLALFAAHAQSGLSAAAFCREQQLCPRYFSLRRRALQWSTVGDGVDGEVVMPRVKRTARATAKFVRVDVMPATRPAVTLSAAGVTVSCSGEVSAQRLLALIDALRTP